MRRHQSITSDLYFLKTNTRWEFKSPTSGSKHTIQNNLRDAGGQSENVVLDLSRAKLIDRQGVSRAKEFIREERSSLKYFKILTRTKKLVDIK